MSEVVVIRTGTANLASVMAALGRCGAQARISAEPRDVDEADRLVLPGVGSFGAAMQTLRAGGLVEPLRRRVAAGRPTLAICLGMQLLAEGSEESLGVSGLGVIRGRARRLPASVRVPQLGWNAVEAEPGCGTLSSGYAYYANSYRLMEPPQGWRVATTDYGGRFVGAIERGAVVACQFHPELSGAWGRGLIERWLAAGRASAQAWEVHRSYRSHGTYGAAGLCPRIIPCLDVRDGRIMKGVRFANLRDAGDPAERAAVYEAQGADELVILDVSATTEGRRTALETVARVREVLSIPITVGGGVRSVDDAAALLDAGADKVSVNTAAVRDPALLTRLAERFGAQCTVLAIDAARRSAEGPETRSERGEAPWEVVVRSGTERTGIDAVAWAARACALGAGELLLTSFDRDGTRSGYDLELLGEVSRAVSVPVIASGGAATASHLGEALRAGADAVLAASIFHDGQSTVWGVKGELLAMGVPVRMDGGAEDAEKRADERGTEQGSSC